jgi:hypothetical protein
VPTAEDVTRVMGILRFWGVEEAKNLQAVLGIVSENESSGGRWERDRGSRIQGGTGEGDAEDKLSRKERRALEFGVPNGVSRRAGVDKPDKTDSGAAKPVSEKLSSQQMIDLALKNRVGSAGNLASSSAGRSY